MQVDVVADGSRTVRRWCIPDTPGLRNLVTTMPYSTAVRTCWLALALLAMSACSAPAPAAPAASPAQGTTTSTATSTSTAAATTSTAATTTSATPGAVALPDHSLTPGATDPRVTQADIGQTICVSGYTTTVRPPESVTEAIKVRTMAAYRLSGSLSNYELDHLIPLELGGAPADIRNLWPEPWERSGARLAAPGGGAESKDKVENAAHRAVCDGQLALATAQQAIAANWYSFGQSLHAL
jgi:hypothetical protein